MKTLYSNLWNNVYVVIENVHVNIQQQNWVLNNYSIKYCKYIITYDYDYENIFINWANANWYLQAIEAKNLIGNYDTSMYLKAQVDNLQGRNDELRRELRESRHECNKVRLDLQRTKEKVHVTENISISVVHYSECVTDL